MRETNIKFWIPKKMLRNSMLVENIKTGEQAYIHRRIFNTVTQNPELSLFIVHRDFMGMPMNWLATPMTF